jgi:excisionase family DNA binding protein
MAPQTKELHALIENLEAALTSAHAAQIAALEALRKLAKQADYRPGGLDWDWELDGSGLEGIPPDVGILTVKETAKLLRLSEGAVYELVQRRQLPSMRFGNRIRIGRRGLVAFLHGMNADEFSALIKRRVEEQEQ